MLWRFTLIDRYDSSTIVDEPMGWSEFSIRIKRHPERHGTIREVQGNSFEFIGKGAELLEQEYEQYGILGKYRLLIEQSCGFAWQEAYTGAVSFDTYERTVGQLCSVTVDIEQIGPVVSFINRFDQKVDIGNAIAFDQATHLTLYDNLSKVVTLPSKAIMLRSVAKNTTDKEYQISGDSYWFPASPTGTMQGQIVIPFDTVEIDSIKTFSTQSVIDFLAFTQYSEYTPETILNEPDQDLACVTSQFQVEFRVKGSIKNLVAGSGNHMLRLVLKRGFNTFNTGATDISFWTLYSGTNVSHTTPFDITFSGTVTLQPGEKLWLNPFLTYVKTTNFADDVRIEFEEETFFKASVISKCSPTPAKVYMINELASRITEAITNNQMKVYSEYLGRRDSQPYSFPSAGCGALRALTTGLDIRRAKLSDGTDPKMFLSMKDLFGHLSATDNVGIGIEGNDKIRIENWKWFYQDEVFMSCSNIDVLKTTIRPDLHYSIFSTGYSKWETEDINGQDEILTKRQYRTQIDQVQNTLEKLSDIIGSGYAIETTRRRSSEDKDWRYDNDVFAICLSGKIVFDALFEAGPQTIMIPKTDFFKVGVQYQVSNAGPNNGTYTVTSIDDAGVFIFLHVAEPVVNDSASDVVFEGLTSQGDSVEIGNIENPANIIDPESVYNYRISPIRMAMRWFDTIMAYCRNITNADKLIFSSGEGNFVAEGKLSGPHCIQEAVVLKENDDLSIPKYADQEDALPIALAERKEYTYPMSLYDFKLASANIYKLVQYKSGCDHGFGWIDEIEYRPNEGKAKFVLIPKIIY